MSDQKERSSLPQKIKKLFSLSWQEQLLLAEIAFRVLVIELALKILPLKTLLKILSKKTRRAQPKKRFQDEGRTSYLVHAADYYLPPKPGCLRRALVLFWILDKVDEAVFQIGIRRQGGALEAHAWTQKGEEKAEVFSKDSYIPIFQKKR